MIILNPRFIRIMLRSTVWGGVCGVLLSCTPQHAAKWQPIDDEDFYVTLLSHRQVQFDLLRDDYKLYHVWDATFNPPELIGVPHNWPDACLCGFYKESREVYFRVHNYCSFRGCVVLKSPEDAVEFFRFFSRYDVWHLTPIDEFEIFPEPNEPIKEERELQFSSIPLEVWRASGLGQPTAVEKDDYYDVTRFVVIEDIRADRIRLYKVVDRIDRSARNYQRLSEEEVIPTPALADDVVLPTHF